MRPTEVDQIVQEVLIELEKWEPYIYYEAVTGSIYIKFPHWGLGSLRVGDHSGRERYAYRWRVRLDKAPDYFGRGIHKGVSFTECGTGKIADLVKRFEREAKLRYIKPGEKVLWGGR